MISFNLAILIIGLFILLLIYNFVQSYKFDKNGIRVMAEVVSTRRVEETDSEGGEEINNYVKVKYMTIEGENKIVEIRIGGKYLKKKYKDNLPIVYLKEESGRPIIENIYNIYKMPIDLLILFVLILISLILIAKGLDANVLIDY